MKRYGVLFLSVFLFTIFSLYGQSELVKNYLKERGEVYFKFKQSDKEIVRNLSKIISIDQVKNGIVWAYANETEYNKFLTYKFDHEVLTPPSLVNTKAILMASTVTEMDNWDRYPTYELYVEMMNAFATNYPDLCQLVEIGTSVNGRKLLAVKISDNVSSDEAEPEFFYTSSMHGDETTGFVVYLRLIDYLLSNYSTDTYIQSLVNGIEIFINPLANPDGTYGDDNATVSGARRYNANGFDLNRNFPSIDDGAYRDEPEIVAMMDFAGQHRFVMSANIHGGAELANYPWDTWLERHADDAWFQHVSRLYAEQAQADAGQNGYFTQEIDGITNGIDWYYTNGSRQDYMVYYHSCREITFEISYTKLLDSENLPTFWNYNKTASLLYMEQNLYGVHGTVRNSEGLPLLAKVSVEGHDLKNSHVQTTVNVGDFHRLIEPGTHNFIFEAEGYVNDTIEIIVDTYTSRIDLDVVLEEKQTFNISGTVVKSPLNTALEGVKIELLNSSILPVYTDELGNYFFENVWKGDQIIRASFNGYYSKIVKLTLSDKDTVINLVMNTIVPESFELEKPEIWLGDSDVDWTQSNTSSYDGEYALKSGVIGNSQTSTLLLTDYFNDGEIQFYKKVSSELKYDLLKFYIDDELLDSWSGEVDWSAESYIIEEGIHTFKWVYVKDSYYTGGQDCAWIDYVFLPELVINEPEIIAIFVDNISTQSTQINLTIHPKGAMITDIVVEYGQDSEYGNEIQFEFTELDKYANNFLGVSIENLLPNQAYHYRVKIVYGEEHYYSSDKTFRTLAVGFDEPDEGMMNIYPNPVRDVLNIVIHNDQFYLKNILIYDYSGRIIKSIECNHELEYSWNLSDLNNGLYIIEFKGKETVFRKKFLKE